MLDVNNPVTTESMLFALLYKASRDEMAVKTY